MPVDPADLYAGYARTSRIAPIERSVLETAFKPYGITIASLRGKSTTELRRTAAAAVLARYRARQTTTP